MSLVIFFKLTHSRMVIWPSAHRLAFLKVSISFNSQHASRFPAALAMAVGQLLLGHPWFGVWLSAGLLAAHFVGSARVAASGWALFGAFIGLELCVFSYWMNSYWGGAVAALGGALVIGAWVRIVRAKQWRYAWLFGIGAVIVILARPFEGSVLVVPALIGLGLADRTARVWLPIIIVGVLGISCLAGIITASPVIHARLPYGSITSDMKSCAFSIVPISKTPRTSIFRS
jgi:hypothetical protein